MYMSIYRDFTEFSDDLEVPGDGLTLDLKFTSISQAWARKLEDNDSI